MAKVRVDYNPDDVRAWLSENPDVKNLIMGVAQGVAGEAQATAGDAEKGAGGRIDGYAAAGFRTEWVGSGRPQARVYSNADSKTITAAHFHTQLVNGVAHLRAALYRFTSRG